VSLIINLSELIAVLTKKSSATVEILAYHKVKRIFLSLAEIQHEDPSLIEIYEFNGENFRLVAQ
jgi:hypothetical protein